MKLISFNQVCISILRGGWQGGLLSGNFENTKIMDNKNHMDNKNRKLFTVIITFDCFYS